MPRLITPAFISFLSIILFLHTKTNAQGLQPGFDKAEYIELLKMIAVIHNVPTAASIAKPNRLRLRYSSAVVGLDNKWELWMRDDSVAVIGIRGTTANQVSWLENFYAAMVPANGALVLGKADTFHYNLTTFPDAAVHVGWLTGLGYMAPEMLAQIARLSDAGIKDFIIAGHSQGGAIAYLLSALLHQMVEDGALPSNTKIKTYCSAAPKPGNLQFAYSHESRNGTDWAFTVLNPKDWVPESPISVQTIHDYNTINPYRNVNRQFKLLPFWERLVVKYAYRRLTAPAAKLSRRYGRYLGNYAGKGVTKNLKGYKAPSFHYSKHYVRAGVAIMLPVDSLYMARFPDTSSNIFTHHLLKPYLWLAEKMP